MAGAQVPELVAVLGGVFTSSPPSSGAEKAQLLRRAQLIARLRHPNLVRMLPLPGGAGHSPVLNGARKLADFTLPAGTFKRFELIQVVRFLVDLLSGLSALHEVSTEGSSFVHGGVSPEQIFIDEHGTARLVPLLNAHLMPGDKHISNGYVAPEQLLGDATDARADLFSVGAMLWEALSGRRLFPDASLDAVIARAVGGKIERLSPPPGVGWALPLCAVAERAIAIDPARRYSSALELQQAIERAAGPRLAELREGNWQDEAPTPVFQPRLHAAQLRSATPPATVVEIAPSSVSRVEAAVPPPAEAIVEVEPQAEAAVNGRRRLGGLLALASIGFAGFALWTNLVPLPHGAIVSMPAPAAAAVAPLVTLAPVAAPPPVVPAVSASASAAPQPLSTPSAAAPSAAVPRAPLPRVVSPAKPRARRLGPAAGEVDYGI